MVAAVHHAPQPRVVEGGQRDGQRVVARVVVPEGAGGDIGGPRESESKAIASARECKGCNLKGMFLLERTLKTII